MNIEQKKCIEHLQKGINHKRNGDLENALKEYEKAYFEYPYNLNIYKNIAKIYMAIGQTDFAMRNILTYSHLTLVDGSVNMEAYDFAVNFYDWSGSLSDKYIINKDIALKAVANDFNLAKIISDLNLTFWAGFCFYNKI